MRAPRTSRRARRLGTLCVVLAAIPCATLQPDGAVADAVPRSAAAPTTTTDDPIVVLGRSHDVYAGPSGTVERRGRVAGRRPITEGRTVLPVLGTAVDALGHRWLRVLLPGRPNGRSGWIRERGTTRDVTPWAIEVFRGRRRVLVRRGGDVVRTFRVVVGAPSTPTPSGRFFVEETVRIPSGGVAGPYALALSARSTVLQEFAGGPGQIALHGRAGLGGTLGSAVSHGCVRLDDAAVRWVAARVGPGVRVTIHR